MTWVPRTPKRSDFCGCPPCPLCFCWAGYDGLVDGMTKFTQDMLGAKKPSKNEEQVLKDAAEAIHVANLSLPERVDAELKEADRTQHIQRQADAMLAQQRAEAARPKAKAAGQCLDDMDLSELEKPKPKPEEYTITWGLPGFVSIFDEIIKRDMDKAFTQMFTASVDLAAPAKKDAKEIQADFAREKAKERMREMARAKR